MNRRAAPSAQTGNGLRIAVAGLFVLVMALVALLLVRARPGPEPFDPRSGRADGARGLVLVLDGLGARVDVTRDVPPPGDATTVLLLDDRLDDRQRTELLDWVESGGTAVVADPLSSLHGGVGPDGGARIVEGDQLLERRLDVEVEANLTPGDCTVDALDGVRGIFVPDGLTFPVGPDDPRCFTRGDTSFVVVDDVGRGRVIGLGDNEPFVNRHLRRADNAALIARLLLVVDPGGAVDPDDQVGAARVTFLLGEGASPTVADVGTGDDTLLDLVPAWVWMTLVVAAMAFVVFAVSRSARIGRIVAEPLATPIAGSELVAATGNLMARARHAPRAAWLLLDRLHRDLTAAFNLPAGASPDELDRAVSARTELAPGELAAVFASRVVDDDGLTVLARRVRQVRRVALGASPGASVVPPSTGPPTGQPTPSPGPRAGPPPIPPPGPPPGPPSAHGPAPDRERLPS